jgi:hypothetical protein
MLVAHGAIESAASIDNSQLTIDQETTMSASHFIPSVRALQRTNIAPVASNGARYP